VWADVVHGCRIRREHRCPEREATGFEHAAGQIRGVKVSIIAVPYDSGQRATRMGRGPDALLGAGLADRLRRGGASVTSTVVVAPTDLFPGEIAVTLALQRQVAEHVADARRDGAFPLVLSGNCITAVGTIAGMRSTGSKRPGICWFDAHADANTPETSTSGFVDGMAVAMLIGACWRPLTHSVPGFAAVPASHVVLVGTRDVDPLEEEAVRAAGIRRLASTGLRDELPSALDALAVCDEVYLHVDLDVLDPSEGRANGYAVTGGLTGGMLRDAVTQVRRHCRVGAASFTAYDPACDPEGRIAVLAVELAGAMTGIGAPT
jgi:arginase